MKIQLSEHFTYKKLLQFVFPSIIMMIFTSIYSVVDGLFVSNFVGKALLQRWIWSCPSWWASALSASWSEPVVVPSLQRRLVKERQKKPMSIFHARLYHCYRGNHYRNPEYVPCKTCCHFIRLQMVHFLTTVFYMDVFFVFHCLLLCLQNVFQSFFVTAEKPHLDFA